MIYNAISAATSLASSGWLRLGLGVGGFGAAVIYIYNQRLHERQVAAQRRFATDRKVDCRTLSKRVGGAEGSTPKTKTPPAIRQVRAQLRPLSDDLLAQLAARRERKLLDDFASLTKQTGPVEAACLEAGATRETVNLVLLERQLQQRLRPLLGEWKDPDAALDTLAELDALPSLETIEEAEQGEAAKAALIEQIKTSLRPSGVRFGEALRAELTRILDCIRQHQISPLILQEQPAELQEEIEVKRGWGEWGFGLLAGQGTFLQKLAVKATTVGASLVVKGAVNGVDSGWWLIDKLARHWVSRRLSQHDQQCRALVGDVLIDRLEGGADFTDAQWRIILGSGLFDSDELRALEPFPTEEKLRIVRTPEFRKTMSQKSGDRLVNSRLSPGDFTIKARDFLKKMGAMTSQVAARLREKELAEAGMRQILPLCSIVVDILVDQQHHPAEEEARRQFLPLLRKAANDQSIAPTEVFLALAEVLLKVPPESWGELTRDRHVNHDWIQLFTGIHMAFLASADLKELGMEVPTSKIQPLPPALAAVRTLLKEAESQVIDRLRERRSALTLLAGAKHCSSKVCKIEAALITAGASRESLNYVLDELDLRNKLETYLPSSWNRAELLDRLTELNLICFLSGRITAASANDVARQQLNKEIQRLQRLDAMLAPFLPAEEIASTIKACLLMGALQEGTGSEEGNLADQAQHLIHQLIGSPVKEAEEFDPWLEYVVEDLRSELWLQGVLNGEKDATALITAAKGAGALSLLMRRFSRAAGDQGIREQLLAELRLIATSGVGLLTTQLEAQGQRDDELIQNITQLHLLSPHQVAFREVIEGGNPLDVALRATLRGEQGSAVHLRTLMENCLQLEGKLHGLDARIITAAWSSGALPNIISHVQPLTQFESLLVAYADQPTTDLTIQLQNLILPELALDRWSFENLQEKIVFSDASMANARHSIVDTLPAVIKSSLAVGALEGRKSVQEVQAFMRELMGTLSPEESRGSLGNAANDLGSRSRAIRDLGNQLWLSKVVSGEKDAKDLLAAARQADAFSLLAEKFGNALGDREVRMRLLAELRFIATSGRTLLLDALSRQGQGGRSATKLVDELIRLNILSPHCVAFRDDATQAGTPLDKAVRATLNNEANSAQKLCEIMGLCRALEAKLTAQKLDAEIIQAAWVVGALPNLAGATKSPTMFERLLKEYAERPTADLAERLKKANPLQAKGNHQTTRSSSEEAKMTRRLRALTDRLINSSTSPGSLKRRACEMIARAARQRLDLSGRNRVDCSASAANHAELAQQLQQLTSQLLEEQQKCEGANRVALYRAFDATITEGKKLGNEVIDLLTRTTPFDMAGLLQNEPYDTNRTFEEAVTNVRGTLIDVLVESCIARGATCPPLPQVSPQATQSSFASAVSSGGLEQLAHDQLFELAGKDLSSTRQVVANIIRFVLKGALSPCAGQIVSRLRQEHIELVEQRKQLMAEEQELLESKREITSCTTDAGTDEKAWYEAKEREIERRQQIFAQNKAQFEKRAEKYLLWELLTSGLHLAEPLIDGVIDQVQEGSLDDRLAQLWRGVPLFKRQLQAGAPRCSTYEATAALLDIMGIRA
jgi:hypothetical protein